MLHRCSRTPFVTTFAFVVALYAASAAARTSPLSRSGPVVPPKASERKTSLEPTRAEPGPTGRVTFQADPIADSAIIVVSLGSAGVLELINSTGEIRPQQIAPNFKPSNLIWID